MLLSRILRRFGRVSDAVAVAILEDDDAPPESVSFTLPEANLFDEEIEIFRRGLLGGNLSGAWVAFDQGGTTFALSGEHAGRRADPTVWHAPLAGATHGFVQLGATAITGAAAAALFVTRALALGVTGISAVGARITVSNASALVIGPAASSDNARSRMFGWTRADFGSASGASTLLATNGNGIVHLASVPTTGRVIGVYIRGAPDGGAQFEPRVTFGVGPAFSVTPGAITIRAQGQSGPVNGVSAIPFLDPVPLDSAESPWIVWRANQGLVGFRSHGLTPTGNGNRVVGEQLVFDATATSDPTVPFGATFTPVAPANFNSYSDVGLIIQVPDGSGNYSADGAVVSWFGDTNPDPFHGSQTVVDLASIPAEGLHFRLPIPQWEDAEVRAVRYAVGIFNINDDAGISLYTWPDNNFPASTPPTLVQSIGAFGLDTPSAYNTHTLSTPVQVGVGVLGTNQTLGVGFTFGRIGGGSLTELNVTFFADAAADGSFLTQWVDDGITWSDWITAGGRGIGPATEYRTQPPPTTTSTMPPAPTPDPAAVWPGPFQVDAGDNQLTNLPPMAFLVATPAIAAG